MANYCTVDDIQVLLQNTFNSTSSPTQTQVEREIDQITNEIDFTLASVGITTQPTDTRLLARLRNACSYGVACRVGMSWFGNNTAVDDTQPGHYCERYQAILDDIKDNPAHYGLVTGDETNYMDSNVLDGTDSEDDITGNATPLDYEY